MITQAAVESNGTEKIYWLRHEARDGVLCEPGRMIAIQEEGPDRYWFVKQTFGGYHDDVVLPPNVREGTIVAVI